MNVVLYLAIGLTIGVASGTLGIGGGVLLVPALVWLCGFDLRTAAGTTLGVLMVPVVLPAAWKYYSDQNMDLEAALWIACAFTVGGLAGAYLAPHVPEQVLRLLFGLLMIFIAVRFMVSASSEAMNAAAGLIATLLAWVAFIALRLLGRRHLSRPKLAAQIQAMQQQGRGEIDYHI